MDLVWRMCGVENGLVCIFELITYPLIMGLSFVFGAVADLLGIDTRWIDV